MNQPITDNDERIGLYLPVPEGQPAQVGTGETWPRVVQASTIELNAELIGRRLRVRAIGERACEVLGLA